MYHETDSTITDPLNRPSGTFSPREKEISPRAQRSIWMDSMFKQIVREFFLSHGERMSREGGTGEGV